MWTTLPSPSPEHAPARPSDRSIQDRIGARLIALRQARGISRAELARRAKTSTSHLHAIERGQRATTVASLERVAQALGVSIADFFADEPRRRETPAEQIHQRIAKRLRHLPLDQLLAVEELLNAFHQAIARSHS